MEESVPNVSTSDYTYAADYDINSTSYPVQAGLPGYIFWYVTLANLCIFVVGVLGNILVLTVIIRHKEMRTHMNCLLCNLCVADLQVLLICQPAGMAEFYAKDRWYLGPVMCKLVPLFENASLNASVLTLWVISCERYQAICRSLKTNICQLAKNAGNCVLLIWACAYLLSLPFFFMTYHEKASFYDGTEVMVCRTRINEFWHFFYVTAMTVLFFLLPLLILLFMYCAIIRKIFLTQSPDEHPPSRQRKQAILMIIGVVTLFFVSLLPIRTVTMWIVYSSNEDKRQLGFEAFTNLICIARIMLNVNSAGNPIIYGLISSRFRMAFRNLGACGSRSSGSDQSKFPTEISSTKNNARGFRMERKKVSFGTSV
ncbi:Pyroglutamylated RFamide peptide receptor [Mizuhopecten yessoensis]|uniref:Pyroglutamylated RFamide peptide receptor n=1 Tax=Mizuhopecten yessoensis TaxID=6573 RepID=A0A210QKJ1_MIZYE|nr:Pyroglutamylated RFamide peptide receptor [Mizuhopecten yessoensis]